MAIADVLLIPDYPLIEEGALRQSEPPLMEAFEVAPGVQLAGIREDSAAAIIARTGFRHKDQNVGAMYAFVRYDLPGERWDQDLQISKALYLSHMIHAHEGGFEFAARLETDDRRRPVKVDPFDVAPPFARAYPVLGVRRRCGAPRIDTRRRSFLTRRNLDTCAPRGTPDSLWWTRF